MIEAPSTSKRILITGASGFIGRALTVYLSNCGHEVLAVSRAPFETCNTPSARVPDYTNVERLTELLRGHDAVIHLAAMAHKKIYGDAETAATAFTTNVDGTLAMAMASAAAGIRRFILISSIGVNGQHTNTLPFTEEDVPQPAEPYAVSKLHCELALRDVASQHPSLDFVIIRPPLVYGPNAPGNFGRLLRAVSRQTLFPLRGVLNQRSFIGLDNLMNFIELCTYHPHAKNQIYLVSDREDVSTAEFIRRIGQAQGTPAKLLKVPLPLISLLARITGRSAQIERLLASLQVDSDKARRQLGWIPPLTLDEGLRRAAAGTHPLERTP
jgi:nucleoside-diphosphate-sugar epimerase